MGFRFGWLGLVSTQMPWGGEGVGNVAQQGFELIRQPHMEAFKGKGDQTFGVERESRLEKK